MPGRLGADALAGGGLGRRRCLWESWGLPAAPVHLASRLSTAPLPGRTRSSAARPPSRAGLRSCRSAATYSVPPGGRPRRSRCMMRRSSRRRARRGSVLERSSRRLGAALAASLPSAGACRLFTPRPAQWADAPPRRCPGALRWLTVARAEAGCAVGWPPLRAELPASRRSSRSWAGGASVGSSSASGPKRLVHLGPVPTRAACLESSPPCASWVTTTASAPLVLSSRAAPGEGRRRVCEGA